MAASFPNRVTYVTAAATAMIRPSRVDSPLADRRAWRVAGSLLAPALSRLAGVLPVALPLLLGLAVVWR